MKSMRQWSRSISFPVLIWLLCWFSGRSDICVLFFFWLICWCYCIPCFLPADYNPPSNPIVIHLDLVLFALILCVCVQKVKIRLEDWKTRVDLTKEGKKPCHRIGTRIKNGIRESLGNLIVALLVVVVVVYSLSLSISVWWQSKYHAKPNKFHCQSQNLFFLEIATLTLLLAPVLVLHGSSAFLLNALSVTVYFLQLSIRFNPNKLGQKKKKTPSHQRTLKSLACWKIRNPSSLHFSYLPFHWTYTGLVNWKIHIKIHIKEMLVNTSFFYFLLLLLLCFAKDILFFIRFPLHKRKC